MKGWIRELAHSAAQAVTTSAVTGQSLSLSTVWQTHVVRELAADVQSTESGQRVVRILAQCADADSTMRVRYAWRKAWSKFGEALAEEFEQAFHSY